MRNAIENLTVSDFDYHLPENLIAQKPVEPRDSSRLLVVRRTQSGVEHKVFRDVLSHLKKGDLLVANDTKVIPARLLGEREDTGGRVEIFLLHRKSKDEWETLVKPGRRLRPGHRVRFGEKLQGEILNSTDFGGRIVRFHYNGIFESVLDELGETPLPPYIRERLDDTARYQTIYARERGSAAAPTAGLHFTADLMEKVQELGADFAFVTLHIGLGTFRPVRVEHLNEHVMHREFYSVSAETASKICAARASGGRIVAVGTTAVRTLEAAGANDVINECSGWTDLFITPGYHFRWTDAMITNFHLPQSTLLMLVSAFAGREKILAAYQEAVRHDYRFFSFGDAMFIE